MGSHVAMRGASPVQMVVALVVTAALVALLFLLLRPAGAPAVKTPALVSKAPPVTAPVQEPAPIAIEPALTAPVADSAALAAAGETALVRHAVTAAPIPGATVALFRRDGLSALAQVEETCTGPDGRFRMATTLRPGSGSWRLRVNHREFASVDRFVSSLPPVIELVPGISFTGEVQDPAGRPVPGGTVYVLNGVRKRPANEGDGLPFLYGIDSAFPVSVGSDGRFAAVVATESVACEARCPGFAPGFSEPAQIAPDGTTHVIVHVEPGVVLQGTVTDAQGKAIQAAQVRVEGVPADREPDRYFDAFRDYWTTTTDASGAFTLVDFSPAWSQVDVSHPEYLPVRTKGPGPASEPAAVVMEAGQWLEGTLLDPTSQPLPIGSAQLGDGPYLPVEIREGGRFRSGPFDPATATLVLRVQGFLPVTLTWPAGRTAGLRGHDTGTHTLLIGRSLEVLVVTLAEAPVADAQVSVHSQGRGQGMGGPALHRTSTNPQGVARATGLGDPQVQLKVWSPDHALHDEVITLGPDDPTTVTVRLSSEALLRGVVQTSTGEPASGAEVAVFPTGQQGPGGGPRVAPLGTVASPAGEFLLRPALGVPLTLQVRSRLGSHDAALTPLSAGEQRELPAIQLGDLIRIAGLVVGENGKPIHGASVSATRGDEQYSMRRHETVATSGADGAFILDLVPGPYGCVTQAEGHVTLRGNHLFDRSRTEPLRLVLQPGVTYEGTVVDASGAPVELAQVRVHGFGSSYMPSATSDADGRFTIPGLANGQLEGTVHHAQYRQFKMAAASPAELPGRIVLQEGATLELAVSTEDASPLPSSVMLEVGQEVAGVSITKSRRSVTLEQGIARLAGLEPGKTRVQVQADGRGSSEPQEANLQEGQVTRVSVVLPGEADPVTILVQDPQGQPVAGAQVRIEEQESGDSHLGGGGNRTDANGIYISRQPLTDRTTLQVEAAGYASQTIRSLATLIQGRELRVSLVPESVLILRVLDEHGNPIMDAWPSLSPRTAQARMSGPRYLSMGQMPAAEPDGSMRLGGLSAGSWLLSVNRKGESLARQEVVLADGEQREVVIEVGEGIVVSGLVLENGAPVRGGHVMLGGGKLLGGTAEVDLQGRFTVTVRGKGTYELRYVEDSIQWSETHRITGPTTITVELTTTQLEALVLDPQGAPVPNTTGTLEGVATIRFTTSETGAFTAPRVIAGEYTWRFQTPPPGLFAPAQKLGIEGPTTATYRFVPGVTFQLEVTLPAGQEGDSYQVYFMDGDQRTFLRPESEGHYRWPAAGGMGLIQGMTLAPTLFTVPPGGAPHPVAVVVAPGGRLQVVIQGASGDSLANHPFRVEPQAGTELPAALRDQRTGRDGGRSLGLAPGTYIVRTTLPGGVAAERTVVMVAGETQEVQLPWLP